MNDFYIRPEEQDSTILEIYDPISAFVEQIEVLMFTEPGEVLGSPDFGIDLERYVHELSLNEYDLKQKISTQIKKFCPLSQNFSWKVDIFFAKSNRGMDAALVNVSIENNTVLGIIV